jgi:uncharacterized protein YhbP (UPF0306 family)
MSVEVPQLIRNYLKDGRLMQLATVAADGHPWVAHVWYAISADLCELVFASNVSRNHSQHIRTNPAVAGGVVAIPLEGLGQKVRGLSFAGVASEGSGDRGRAAYELYAGRWPNVRAMFAADDVDSDATPMRMYIVTVETYVLFDEVHFPSQPRQEYRITSSATDFER